MCVVFTTPLFSFNEVTIEVTPCTDTSTLLANTISDHTRGGLSTEDWLTVFNNCIDTSSHCHITYILQMIIFQTTFLI